MPAVTDSSRAALSLPVKRLATFLRKSGYAKRLKAKGAVYFTGVLERFAYELLRAARRETTRDNRHRTKPVDLARGVYADSDLRAVMRDVRICNSGARLSVPEVRLTRKAEKADKAARKAARKAKAGGAAAAAPKAAAEDDGDDDDATGSSDGEEAV